MELQFCGGHRIKISDFLYIRSKKFIVQGLIYHTSYVLGLDAGLKIPWKTQKLPKFCIFLTNMFQKQEGASNPKCALRHTRVDNTIIFNNWYIFFWKLRCYWVLRSEEKLLSETASLFFPSLWPLHCTLPLLFLNIQKYIYSRRRKSIKNMFMKSTFLKYSFFQYISYSGSFNSTVKAHPEIEWNFCGHFLHSRSHEPSLLIACL